MAEILGEQTVEITEAVSTNIGKITILEALATETSGVSPDAIGRCTMQGQVDFDD